VWTIGCSTGEEAYTLGILLLEQTARLEKNFEIQVLASNLDDPSLALAREGVYPAAIEADVSLHRLERFFTPRDNHYQVKPELRDIVLFTNHSVLRDPPFSKLDLISCRNLLIYLNRDMHEDVLDVFHYALNPGGYLFLGGSETADSVKELFQVMDKSNRIYKAKPWSGDHPHAPAMPLRSPRSSALNHFIPPRTAQRRFISGMPPLEEQHLKALETFGPPSIWVDEDFMILNLSESAGRYLLQPGGPITSDLLRLVRPELQIELRSALFQAFEKGKSVVNPPVLVNFNGRPHRVVVSVRPEIERPKSNRDSARKALVIFLEDESEPQEKEASKNTQEVSGEHDYEMVQQLEQEVQHLRDRLQATIEEYNSSNEEMKAANEELQSINEEYRSTTEELETSKEELQSVNEELQTVNNELRNKLEEVSRAHSDLENLMDATRITTLFLDRELKIKRYTPGMEELFNIRPSDRGRPISDFTHRLGYQELVKDAKSVLQELHTLERESTSPEGGWLLIRLRPYRTVDNRIEGVVVSFVDITDVKKAQRTQRDYESFYTLFHSNPIPTILTRLADNVVMNVNHAFLDYLNVSREEVVDHTAREFSLGLDLNSKDRTALTTQLLKDGHIRNFEEVITLPFGATKTVLTSIQYINIEDTDAIISTFIDISDRVQAEQQVRQLTIDLTTAEQEERYRISQMLHDDLQQRIFAVKMQLENMEEALERKDADAAKVDFVKLEEWLMEAISITRQLSTDLSPLSLKGEELPEVILWLASQVKKQYDLNVELDANDVRTNLDNNLQLVLFHAIRELLFNVVKHAGVLEAKIFLQQRSKDWLQITVSDEGIGFDPEVVLAEGDTGGFGLLNMKHRLELFGCNVQIASQINQGTQVSIDVPLRGSGSLA
jgi:two-component system CheB/CheR fusion protein